MAEGVDEKTIRCYLLGELAEAEMSPFEERLMASRELFEALLVVEDDLIDEGAAGELAGEEQTRFAAYFLATAARRTRLQFALTLRQLAARQDGASLCREGEARPRPGAVEPGA